MSPRTVTAAWLVPVEGDAEPVGPVLDRIEALLPEYRALAAALDGRWDVDAFLRWSELDRELHAALDAVGRSVTTVKGSQP